MKIQQPKVPETRTKEDFLFEKAIKETNSLSKMSARKIGSKSKKKPSFLDLN